ncbi:hypothetical protein EI555_001683, partial [Monodon monoceros]
MGGKNAIRGRQRTRICMKYRLKAFITVGVLGGDGQSAAVVNLRRRTLSGWSRTAPELVSRITGLDAQTRPQAEGRGEPSARPSPEHASSVPRRVALAGVDVSHGNGERVETSPRSSASAFGPQAASRRERPIRVYLQKRSPRDAFASPLPSGDS